MGPLLFSALCMMALLSSSVGAPNAEQTDTDDIALALRHYVSEENADAQQICEYEGFDIRLRSKLYQLRHCANSKFTMFCYDRNRPLPIHCPNWFRQQMCYTFIWATNFKTYQFKICPFYNTYCMTSWSPNLSSNCDRTELATGQQIKLCEELPDGKEHCKTLQPPYLSAVLQEHKAQAGDNGCLCVITPDKKQKLCEGSGCPTIEIEV